VTFIPGAYFANMYNGLQQMLSCTAAHLDAGYKLNQWT